MAKRLPILPYWPMLSLNKSPVANISVLPVGLQSTLNNVPVFRVVDVEARLNPIQLVRPSSETSIAVPVEILSPRSLIRPVLSALTTSIILLTWVVPTPSRP